MKKTFIYFLLLFVAMYGFIISCEKKPSSVTAASPGNRVAVDVSSCIACRKCVAACPQNAIIFVDNKAEIIQTKCVQCERCILVCPEDAIR